MARWQSLVLGGAAIAAIAGITSLALHRGGGAALGAAAADQAIAAYLATAPAGTSFSHGPITYDPASQTLRIPAPRWADGQGHVAAADSLAVSGFDPLHPLGRLAEVTLDQVTLNLAGGAPSTLRIAHAQARDADPSRIAQFIAPLSGPYHPAGNSGGQTIPPIPADIALGELRADGIAYSLRTALPAMAGGSPVTITQDGQIGSYRLTGLRLGVPLLPQANGSLSQTLGRVLAATLAMGEAEERSEDVRLTQTVSGDGPIAGQRLTLAAASSLRSGEGARLARSQVTGLQAHLTGPRAELAMTAAAFTITDADATGILPFLRDLIASGRLDGPADPQATAAWLAHAPSIGPGTLLGRVSLTDLVATLQDHGGAGAVVVMRAGQIAQNVTRERGGATSSTASITSLAVDLRRAGPAMDQVLSILNTPVITADLVSTLRYEPVRGAFQLTPLRLDLHDLGSLSLTAAWQTAGLAGNASPGMAGGQDSKPNSLPGDGAATRPAVVLEHAQLTYQDRSLFNRVLHLAATLRHMPDSSLRGALRVSAALAAAAFPQQPDAAAVLSGFIDRPGQLTLRIQPASPLDLLSLDKLPPAARLAALNLSVSAAP